MTKQKSHGFPTRLPQFSSLHENAPQPHRLCMAENDVEEWPAVFEDSPDGLVTERHFIQGTDGVPSQAAAGVGVLEWQIGIIESEPLQYRDRQMNGGGFNGTVNYFRLLGHGSTKDLAYKMAIKNPDHPHRKAKAS